MWNFFKGSQPQSNYDVQGEKLAELSLRGKCLFDVFDAKKKSSTLSNVPGPEKATIFICEATSPTILDLAKLAVKKLKMMRHPSILTYIESYESDKSVFLVTEQIKPLSVYLNDDLAGERGPKRDYTIAWGIFQV